MAPSLAERSSHLKPQRWRGGFFLPRLIVMTDHGRMPDPVKVVSRLPRNSLVILRDYDHADRMALASAWASACRRYHCLFCVGNDENLARRVRADGVHWPEKRLPKRPRRRWPISTAAAHSKKAILRARNAGMAMALVSPVFATTSHPGARTHDVPGYRRMVRGARIAIAVLGGINAHTAQRLVHPRPHAYAAIMALVPD